MTKQKKIALGGVKTPTIWDDCACNMDWGFWTTALRLVCLMCLLLQLILTNRDIYENAQGDRKQIQKYHWQFISSLKILVTLQLWPQRSLEHLPALKKHLAPGKVNQRPTANTLGTNVSFCTVLYRSQNYFAYIFSFDSQTVCVWGGQYCPYFVFEEAKDLMDLSRLISHLYHTLITAPGLPARLLFTFLTIHVPRKLKVSELQPCDTNSVVSPTEKHSFFAKHSFLKYSFTLWSLSLKDQKALSDPWDRSIPAALPQAPACPLI